MPSRSWETLIDAPIDAVWAFYENIASALPALSPPGDDVRIESIDLPPRAGTKVVINARGPLGMRIRWVARYDEHVPPHDVVFGREARFVDVQESGPFAAWRHSHEMEAVDDRTTRLVDRVTYRVPLGPLGWVGDWLLVRPKLRAMFEHRHEQTRRLCRRQ